jgi:hypothetical protein
MVREEDFFGPKRRKRRVFARLVVGDRRLIAGPVTLADDAVCMNLTCTMFHIQRFGQM